MNKCLKLVPDHFRAKKICKHTVKNLPFLIKCVPDQQRCDKVIQENVGMLMFIPDYYKNKDMCNKSIGTARKATFSISKGFEKMVFPEKLHWKMIFLVLSGKMIFSFS